MGPKVILTAILRTVLWIALLSDGPSLSAQQATDDIRGLARNPLADAIKVPIGESISFDAGPNNRIGNSIQLEPIIPIAVTGNWLLIPRIVTTVVAYQPDVTRTSGGSTGTGDTVATLYYLPFTPDR